MEIIPNQQEMGVLEAIRMVHVGRHTPQLWSLVWGVQKPVNQRRTMSRDLMWGVWGLYSNMLKKQRKLLYKKVGKPHPTHPTWHRVCPQIIQ